MREKGKERNEKEISLKAEKDGERRKGGGKEGGK